MDAELISDYEFQSSIGEGGFSKVYQAIHKPTGVRVAVKIIPKAEQAKDKNRIPLRNEIEALKKVHHPFICRFFDVIESDDYVYLIMECLKNGTLLDEVTKKKLDERGAAITFAEFALALQYLHKEAHIAHRDIKLENVLLDDNHNIRIIDFGFAKETDHGNCFKTHCGSILYAAPELLLGEEYTEKVDIWSAGVMLFIMTTGSFPFYHENMSICLQKIVMSEVQFPGSLSFSLKDFLMRMLTKDPKERISIDQVLEHPWLRSYAKEIDEMIKGIYIDDNLLELEAEKYKTSEDVSDDLIKNIVRSDIYSSRTKSIFYMSQTKPMNSRSLPMLRPISIEKVPLSKNISGKIQPTMSRKIHMSSPVKLRTNKKPNFLNNMY